MTCPKCNAPIDAEMQSCTKCGGVVASANEVKLCGSVAGGNSGVVTKRPRISGCQTALIVVALSALVFGVFIYGIISSMIEADYRDIAKRGADIVVAINSANRSRAGSEQPPVWPKTKIDNTNHLDGISSKAFMTSSDFFYELYDGPNLGTVSHAPYIEGFDYSKLAGAGVPAKAGGDKLEAKNNMWIIAANITAEDDPRIPVLISRNVDAKEFERIVNYGLKKCDFRKRITFSKTYSRPFQDKGYILICKDGSSKHSRGLLKKTLGELFDNKELPPRDPSKPPIVYLMP